MNEKEGEPAHASAHMKEKKRKRETHEMREVKERILYAN